MADKIATFGPWKVVRHEDKKVDVFKNDQLCDKSAPVLREIAEEIGLAVKPEWRTSQLGMNVLRAMLNASGEKPASDEPAQEMTLIEKMRESFIVETDDEVYYDAEGAWDDETRDMFINNIKAQNMPKENEIFEQLKFTSADAFVDYLDNDPDELSLAQKIVAAAYCTQMGIEIDDDTQEYVDEQLYYFNDCRDLHYEYETDIDLG